MRSEGRNRNTNDNPTVTTVEINSVTATTIAVANPDRFHLTVSLDAGINDIQAFVRPYPAAQDNIKHGKILVRNTSGNQNLFEPSWETPPDNPPTSEISAISMAGTFDLHIMEW